MLPPARLHCLPNRTLHWGPGVQTHEPVGSILIQTNTPSLELIPQLKFHSHLAPACSPSPTPCDYHPSRFLRICLDLVSKAEFLLFAYFLYIHRSSMDQHLGSLYLVSILNKNCYEHWSTSTFASLYFHYFWSVYLKKLLDCEIILCSIFFLFYLLISGNILTISYFCTTHWDHIHYTAFSYSPHVSV